MSTAKITVDAPEAARRVPSRLWLWFLVAFILQASVWTAWLVIASRHPVREVPLAAPR